MFVEMGGDGGCVGRESMCAVLVVIALLGCEYLDDIACREGVVGQTRRSNYIRSSYYFRSSINSCY